MFLLEKTVSRAVDAAATVPSGDIVVDLMDTCRGDCDAATGVLTSVSFT